MHLTRSTLTSDREQWSVLKLASDYKMPGFNVFKLLCFKVLAQVSSSADPSTMIKLYVVAPTTMDVFQ